MFRSTTKTKHDQAVLIEANKYYSAGYTVTADHNVFYPQPSKIGDFIPDVYAKRVVLGTLVEIVLEVETFDSVLSDEANKQAIAFRFWVNQYPERRNFKQVVV
ncbi:MAG: hypothetical protein AAB881_01515 [Patescibacteria group bacterium]